MDHRGRPSQSDAEVHAEIRNTVVPEGVSDVSTETPAVETTRARQRLRTVLSEEGEDHEEVDVSEDQDRLRPAGSGERTAPADVCRQLGVSEATFYI